jgi:hypothetical protein
MKIHLAATDAGWCCTPHFLALNEKPSQDLFQFRAASVLAII